LLGLIITVVAIKFPSKIHLQEEKWFLELLQNCSRIKNDFVACCKIAAGNEMISRVAARFLIENCRGLVGFCTSGWWEVKSARTLVSS
jgi:hypothetical protein